MGNLAFLALRGGWVHLIGQSRATDRMAHKPRFYSKSAIPLGVARNREIA
jgi:hypothetical protein